ncbi:ECF RNA polymerase sigma factor SigW [Polystyrenella longa]|uniref:ECF RNA polymerase sigma factor SigW n=1 Tax=Polystyrenella longa TaxID=2528007 RepID=A0A518CTH1_9PLAN|nr:sigma-70 family RNA polymerase sigma factor [Polystyrenella longa]QDU82519.1 ECF RNA polymerase sigma factor SigW [Polystyrenella longa]
MSLRNNNSQSTSANLIREAKAHQEQAWNRLVDTYGPLIYKWCSRTGLGFEDSSDVTQEVLTYVYKSIDDFEVRSQKGSFRRWLWVITNHRKIDFLRKANRSTGDARGGTSMNLYLQNKVIEPRTDDSSDRNSELQQKMLIALNTVAARIDEDSWRAFEMLVFESMTANEVAKILNKSPTAIRVTKSRIMKSLRQLMSDDILTEVGPCPSLETFENAPLDEDEKPIAPT